MSDELQNGREKGLSSRTGREPPSPEKDGLSSRREPPGPEKDALSNSDPPDQAQRELIVSELDQSMLVEAAAGTGKTTSMIARMIALLESGRCEIDSMAAVTFTRKAAAQIRVRFQNDLEQAWLKARHQAQSSSESAGSRQRHERLQRLANARDHQQRCFIGTIHSFCARLLRERPVEAAAPLDFHEIEEAQDAELRRRAWRQYVDTLLAVDDPIVQELEQVGLRLSRSSQQRRQVIDELEELGLELPQLGGAFMSMADYPDVQQWPAESRTLPDLAPARQALLEYIDHLNSLQLRDRSAGSCNLIPKINRLTLAERHLRWQERDVDLMSLLEHFEAKTTKPTLKQWQNDQLIKKESDQLAKDEETRWIEFRDQWAAPLLLAWREHRYAKVIQVLLPALDVYQKLREDINALNFQDLLLRARDLLLLPHVRRYFHRRITHLLVDEFQDTDPLQAELMMLLTADDVDEQHWHACRPTPGSLFVVGDPKQSIYRFRRADMEIYFAVREILSKCATIVNLSANFRSSAAMVDWVNETFDSVFPTELNRRQAPRRSLEHGGGAALGDALGPPTERSWMDENRYASQAARAEAAWIAKRVQQLMAEHPDLRPEHFLLLTSTKARLHIYAEALQRAGIPHEVTGGNELNNSPELTLLQQLLRALTRTDDAVALLGLLRSELFGIADDTLFRWRQDAERLQLYADPPEDDEGQDADMARLAAALDQLRQYEQWLSRLPLPIAVERVANHAGLMARAAAASSARAGALGKAIELLRAGAIEGSATDLLDRLDALVDDTERRDGVPGATPDLAPMRVMNLHQAKGLEAEVVFLADPSGSRHGPIRMHIDRTGDQPRGCLAIYSGLMAEEKYRRKDRLLACPVGWSELEAEERAFLDAERERLMYVAGTRAASKLIVCPREGHNNPWAFFQGRVPDSADDTVLSFESTEPSGEAEQPEESEEELAKTAELAAAAIEQRWAAGVRPTYGLGALKEMALKGAPKKPTGEDDDGAYWGSAVHALLETMLVAPDSDVRRVARDAIREQGLRQARVDELLDMWHGVRQSAIWRRASRSSQRYCEAPVCSLLPASLRGLAESAELPTLTRGVIDLVFREEAGWVIVDYKSDAITLIEVQAAARHYRPQLQAYAAVWTHLSGEPVVETGVLFTHHSRYIRCDDA